MIEVSKLTLDDLGTLEEFMRECKPVRLKHKVLYPYFISDIQVNMIPESHIYTEIKITMKPVLETGNDNTITYSSIDNVEFQDTNIYETEYELLQAKLESNDLDMDLKTIKNKLNDKRLSSVSKARYQFAITQIESWHHLYPDLFL